MNAADIKQCLQFMAYERCITHISDLRFVLNLMKGSLAPFNFNFALRSTINLHKQGKHEEVGMMLELLAQHAPRCTAELIAKAEELANMAADEMQQREAFLKDASTTDPTNDNIVSLRLL